MGFFTTGNSDVDASVGTALGGFFSQQLDRILPPSSTTATSRTASAPVGVQGNPSQPVSAVAGSRPVGWKAMLATPAAMIVGVVAVGLLAWALLSKRK